MIMKGSDDLSKFDRSFMAKSIALFLGTPNDTITLSISLSGLTLSFHQYHIYAKNSPRLRRRRIYRKSFG